jgi:hypothetical protein
MDGPPTRANYGHCRYQHGYDERPRRWGSPAWLFSVQLLSPPGVAPRWAPKRALGRLARSKARQQTLMLLNAPLNSKRDTLSERSRLLGTARSGALVCYQIASPRPCHVEPASH